MDTVRITPEAVQGALPGTDDGGSARALAAENRRLEGTIRKLQEQLARERARNQGLERGLSALSQRVSGPRPERDARLPG